MKLTRPVRNWIGGAIALQLFVALLLLPAPAGAATYANLNPGGPADLPEQVPVNVVFVGFDPGDIDQGAFRAALPREYRPVVRSRLLYGVTELLGLSYTYDYKLTVADGDYANRLFGYLSSIATPADLTDFQLLYNMQAGNALDVAGNHFIDAPSVERWLARNPPAGVNTHQNTVFFINWWGGGAAPRAGFKHHVYTKIGEPDPDTGFDFGRELDSRKVVAWGGTTADDPQTGLGQTYRVWFYDLSAGPDAYTGSWNVDDADLDGDDAPDYRIPPIWEYFAPGGYRSSGELTGDLARAARYVAINLLFTPSPLYPPGYTPERLPSQINLDLTVYEGAAGINATRDYLKPAYVLEKISKVHRVPYTVDLQTYKLNAKTRSCYYRFAALLNGIGPDVPCYREYSQYPGQASLFLDSALSLSRIRDGRGGEYEAGIINYAVEEPDGVLPPFLGFADDNYYDGTQSFAFNLLSHGIIESGYGLTTTDIHEYGHHLAFSHPHDGYDYEEAVDYGPSGDFYFSWAGTEVNSMMAYIDLNWDFSQFDRDNINRFYAAAYIANANAIAADILASPNSGAAAADLATADSAIGAARAALASHNYVATFDSAKRAYEAVRTGAAKANVTVVASDRGVFVEDPAGRVPVLNPRKQEITVDLIDPESPRFLR